TQRKEAELELRKSKERAEESDRLKSAFLATMNHELRTPLNHILGFSELLKWEPGKANDYAQVIKNSGQHLLEIIEDIFKLALADQSEIVPRNQLFTLDIIFGESKQVLIEILETSGKNDCIELIFNPDTSMLSKNLMADINKIKQVLGNLFKNAVKFTGKGRIEFGFYSDASDYLTFYVSDTGVGISKDKHHVVFDSFRQVDDSHSRKHGGLGIGLAISKKIAEVLKGSLTFVSELGAGSTFYFNIPFEAIELPYKHTGLPISPLLQGKTILVAEDDPHCMSVMRMFLSATGANIIEAVNGQDALEKFTPSVHLIFMDLCMPVLNGYEATRRIKKMVPNVPVIAVTAFALPNDKPKAIEAGCDSIICKPVNRELLLAEITRHLINTKLFSGTF
ncbi:MAG TPA: ATP-binding protein, partial [Bacteroidales bacterium]